MNAAPLDVRPLDRLGDRPPLDRLGDRRLGVAMYNCTIISAILADTRTFFSAIRANTRRFSQNCTKHHAICIKCCTIFDAIFYICKVNF